MNGLYISKDVLHIILEYDGRIKYRRGVYLNQIARDDPRNNTIETLLYQKIEIIKMIKYGILIMVFE